MYIYVYTYLYKYVYRSFDRKINYSERGTPYVMSFCFDGINVTLHCFAILAGRFLNLISLFIPGNFPYKKVF